MKDNKDTEKRFDDLIRQAIELAIEDMEWDYPEPEPHEFSKEHEAKMRELFRQIGNKSD